MHKCSHRQTESCLTMLADSWLLAWARSDRHISATRHKKTNVKFDHQLKIWDSLMHMTVIIMDIIESKLNLTFKYAYVFTMNVWPTLQRSLSVCGTFRIRIVRGPLLSSSVVWYYVIGRLLVSLKTAYENTFWNWPDCQQHWSRVDDCADARAEETNRICCQPLVCSPTKSTHFWQNNSHWFDRFCLALLWSLPE